MHRFFIPHDEIRSKGYVLSGPQWHHGKTVLRLTEGDRLSVFDGEGNEYLVSLDRATPHEAHLHVLSHTKTPKLPYSMTLFQALPKNKTMDMIIQKATELGVSEIRPILSDRSVVRMNSDEASEKIQRWHQISIEAAKQCGINWLPKIGSIQTVKEVCSQKLSYSLALIGSLQSEAKPLWNYLESNSIPLTKVAIMIGPEGDFTPAEIGQARSAGFQPLSLGPLVLRSDTAVIYAMSILSYELNKTYKNLSK